MRKCSLVQHGLQDGQQFALDQDSLCFGVGKLVGQLALFVDRIDRAESRSNSRGSIKKKGVFWTIGGERTKMIPFAQSKPLQSVGQAVDHRDNFAIGQDEFMVDDRLALRKTVNSHAQQVIIKNIREIHLKTIEFGSYHWWCHILDPF